MSTLDFLNDLDSPAATAVAVALDDIKPDPKQPRSRFREVDGNVSSQALTSIDELGDSILDLGLQQPITLREDVEEGGYIIVFGESRWRAFLRNRANGHPGHDAIPAFVRNDMSMEKIRLVQLAENLNRDDLTDLEVATFVKATLEENPGLKKSTMASIIRRDSQYISRILALLNPKWANVVDSGLISYASLLEQFRALPEHSREEVVSKVKAEGRSKITSGDLKAAREKVKAKSTNRSVHIDPGVAQSVDQLLAENTPQGEHYSPPAGAFSDRGVSDAVIPSTIDAVNVGLAVKRTVKLTARQLKALIDKGALTGKEKGLVVELVMPLDDMKRMHKKLGGKVPENDTQLPTAFMDHLNSI